MVDKEREILLKVKKALPTLSEFQKGYILGRVEVAAEKSCKLEDSVNADATHKEKKDLYA